MQLYKEGIKMISAISSNYNLIAKAAKLNGNKAQANPVSQKPIPFTGQKKGLDNYENSRINYVYASAKPNCSNIKYNKNVLEKYFVNKPLELVKGGKNSTFSLIVPEFKKNFDNKQTGVHAYTVGWHIINAYKNMHQLPDFQKMSPKNKILCQLAILFHDIGKVNPTIYANKSDEENTQKLVKSGYPRDFAEKQIQKLKMSGDKSKRVPHANHDEVSSVMARKIMTKLGYSQEDIDSVASVIRVHTKIGNLSHKEYAPKTQRKIKGQLIDRIKSACDMYILKVITKADISGLTKKGLDFLSKEQDLVIDRLAEELAGKITNKEQKRA